MRRPSGLPVGLRAGQRGLLRRKCALLVRIGDGRSLDVSELKTQELDLAGTRPGVAPECRESLVDLGDGAAGLDQPFAVDAAELVKSETLCPRRQQ